jgi:hypothetical protein
VSVPLVEVARMCRHPAALAAWVIACAASTGTTHRAERTAPAAQAQEVTPAPEAARLLGVRVSGGFWSSSAHVALFWSDGTLQLETVEGQARRASARRLTPAQMQRVRAEMSALALCGRGDDLCTREDATDAGWTYYEVFADGQVAQRVEHYHGSTGTPRAFLDYEAYVLSLLKPLD